MTFSGGLSITMVEARGPAEQAGPSDRDQTMALQRLGNAVAVACDAPRDRQVSPQPAPKTHAGRESRGRDCGRSLVPVTVMKTRLRLAAVVTVVALLAVAPGSAAAAPLVGPVWAPTLPVSLYQGYVWLSATPDGGAFVLRDNADALGGVMFRSGDFGVTWEPLGYAPFGGDGNGTASFASKTLGYGSNGSGVWRTTDGGTTWEVLDPMLFDGESLSGAGEVRAVKGTDIVWRSSRLRSRELVLAVSEDRGETWDAVPLGVTGSTHRVTALDARHALVQVQTMASNSIADAVYAVSPAEGELRATKAVDCSPHFFCSAVGYLDEDTWFVGWRDGRLTRTDDGGATFTETVLAGLGPVPPGLENAYWIEGVEFADDEVGYVATAGRGMFRTADGGVTWVREGPSTTDAFGVAIGDLSVADRDHAIAGGRGAVVTRLPD